DAALGAARTTLGEIRHTINAFRDDSWAGLVRTRNRLLVAITGSGGVTFLLLVTALSVRPQQPTPISLADPLLGASVFYLVGAIVGLFNRMYSESNNATVEVEDYGLTLARIGLTPLLSGLAAIAGVLVVGLVLSGAGNAVSGARALPSVADMYNLE